MKITLITLWMILFCVTLKGQVPDSVRYRTQQTHLQLLLGIDKAKALEVAKVVELHRNSLHHLFRRTGLDASQRQSDIIALDSLRNQRLKELLTTDEYLRFKRLGSQK